MSFTTRTIEVSTTPSERLCRARAAFGVLLRRAEPSGARPVCDPAHVDALLATPPGTPALVSGPSGSGKSTLLHALEVRLRAQGASVQTACDAWARIRDDDRAIIDVVDTPVERTLRIFSLAGLAEPRLWARRLRELSDGERARLAIALAMAILACTGRGWLLVDEFASKLDAQTARSLARTVRRWANASSARVVAASVHTTLAPWLDPRVHIKLELGRG